MITILHIRTTVEWFVKWREPASVQLEEGTEAIDNSLNDAFRIIQYGSPEHLASISSCEHSWSDLTWSISCSSSRYSYMT